MPQINLDFPPPTNWQDFERLTRSLCKDEWLDHDAETVGRAGQTQHGVDVVGWDYRHPSRRRTGVQCKRRSQTGIDGSVLSGGLVSMDDITDSLKQAVKLSVRLESFALATTAHQDARLQQEVAAFNVTRRQNGQCEAVIWFWEWFQEKLNRNFAVAVAYYKDVLESNGAYSIDRHIASVLRHGFNRALMMTRFRSENQIGSVAAAIEALQRLLATGYLRDADAQLVLSCSPPRLMTNSQDRTSIDAIEKRLQELRDDVAECHARRDIYQSGDDWIVVSDPKVGERLDQRRASILVELNHLLCRHDIVKIESPLLVRP